MINILRHTIAHKETYKEIEEYYSLQTCFIFYFSMFILYYLDVILSNVCELYIYIYIKDRII